MAWRPKLRSELERRTVPADGGGSEEVLHDPVIHRVVEMGPITRAILERLDGERTVGAIIDEVERAFPEAGRATVERTMRTFLLTNLVEGAGERVLERMRAVRAGAVALEPRFIEETRFACQGSGQCCRNYDLGPLYPEDVERLARLDIARTQPQVGAEPYLEDRKLPDGTTVPYLRRVDGRCVFLLPNARCGIHAAFGAAAKPNVCQLFPWRYKVTIEGLEINDRGECATFAVSSRAGTSVRDEAERVRALMPKQLPLYHPLVILGDKVGCDFGYFLELRRAQCELVARRLGDIGATLRALGASLRAFVAEVGACPLAAGEPDATIAALVGRDPRSFFPEPGATPSPRAFASLAKVAETLLRTVRRFPLEQELRPTLGTIAALAAHRVDPSSLAHSRGALEASALPFENVDVDAILRVSFRNYIFGSSSLLLDRPVAGLLRLAIVTLVSILGARLRAHARGARAAAAADLSAGHSSVMAGLQQEAVERALVELEPLAWDAIEATPSLAPA